MKFDLLSTILFAALGASAQTVSFIGPAFDSSVKAGVPFTATLALQDTTSSLDIIALFFGAQPTGDPTNQDLGGKLSILVAPTFSTIGPMGQMTQNVNLTIPVGFAGPVNITCGEFYTLGAMNTPFTHVTKTRVIVS